MEVCHCPSLLLGRKNVQACCCLSFWGHNIRNQFNVVIVWKCTEQPRCCSDFWLARLNFLLNEYYKIGFWKLAFLSRLLFPGLFFAPRRWRFSKVPWVFGETLGGVGKRTCPLWCEAWPSARTWLGLPRWKAERWSLVPCISLGYLEWCWHLIFCLPLVKLLEKDIRMKTFCVPDTKKKGKTLFTIIFLW